MSANEQHETNQRRQRLAAMIRSVTPQAWRVAFSLMGNREDAEDLLQEAYLRAAQKSADIPARNPWPWFAQVLTYQAYNARRRRSTLRAHSKPMEATMSAPAPDASPEAATLDQETSDELRARLLELPSPERDALSLTYVAGLTHVEAAAALGIPLGTLKKRVRTGVEELRVSMKDRELKIERSLALLPFGAPAAGLQLATEGWVALALKACAFGAAGGIIMKKSVALIVLALLLLLGSGGALFLFGPGSGNDHSEPAPHLSQGTDAANPHAAKTNGRIAVGDDAESAKPISASSGHSSVKGAKSNDVTEVKTEKDEPLELGTPFAATISGRVVDFTGAPIAGALVRALPAQDGASERRALSTQGSTTSDEQGDFALAIAGRRNEAISSALVALEASAKSFVTITTDRYALSNDEAIRGVRIPLRASAGSLSGRVLSEADGTPVVGAHVSCTAYLASPQVIGAREEGLRVDVRNEYAAPELLSDANGEFTFQELPDGSFTVRAWLGDANAKPAAPWAKSTPIRSAEAPMQRVRADMPAPRVELLLPDHEEIRFRVSPAQSEVAFDLQFFVRAHDYSGEGLGVPLRPDEEGVFRADWLRREHKFALITALGFEQSIVAISPKAGESLDLGTIELKVGYQLEGRVTARGSGVEGAKVWVQRASQAGGSFARAGGFPEQPHLIETESGPNGRFVIAGLPANGSFEVLARHPDYADGRKNLAMTTGKAPHNFEIELEAGGTLYGSVQRPPMTGGGESSNMLEQDAIVLTDTDRARVARTTALDAQMLGFLAGSAMLRFPIDAEGLYRAENVPPGSYMALAIYDRRITYHLKIEVKAGQEHRLDFTFPPPGGIVEGQITRNGVPLAGRGVQLLFAPKPNGTPPFGGAFAETDRDGNYRFSGVREGRFVVAVSGASDTWSEELINERLFSSEDERKVINIDLKEFRATISGTATLGGKAAFVRTSLTPLKTGIPSRDLFALVNTDGSYRIDEVPAGEYQLWFSGGEGYRSQFNAMTRVSVPEGVAELIVNKDFATASLSGKVEILGNEGGLPKIEILAEREFEPEMGKVSTMRAQTQIEANRDGDFSFPFLWAGEWKITVSAAGYMPETRNIRLRGAIHQNFKLTGPAGVLILELSGIDGVHPKTLERGASAQVQLFDSKGESVRTATLYYGKGAANSLRLESLAAGRYRAEISGGSVESISLEGIVVVASIETTSSFELYGAAWAKFEVVEDSGQPSALEFTKATRRLFRANDEEIIPLPYPSTFTARVVSRFFFLMPLAAGDYRLEIEIPGYGKLVENFTISRGDKKTIMLTFTPD